MLSPEAARDVESQTALHLGERELKFTLPASRAHLARRWLRRLCRRDPSIPGRHRLDDLLRHARRWSRSAKRSTATI